MNNKIEEPYCSFELSKLLKEKGFDVSVTFAYTRSKERQHCGYPNSSLDTMRNSEAVKNYSPNAVYSIPLFSSPTHAIAIEWIRLNFKMWITVEVLDSGEWFWNVTDIPFTKFFNSNEESSKFYTTPAEATDAALLYILKNLI